MFDSELRGRYPGKGYRTPTAVQVTPVEAAEEDRRSPAWLKIAAPGRSDCPGVEARLRK
jgi:hypothetical protein